MDFAKARKACEGYVPVLTKLKSASDYLLTNSIGHRHIELNGDITSPSLGKKLKMLAYFGIEGILKYANEKMPRKMPRPTAGIAGWFVETK
jgi:hypothetical protein